MVAGAAPAASQSPGRRICRRTHIVGAESPRRYSSLDTFVSIREPSECTPPAQSLQSNSCSITEASCLASHYAFRTSLLSGYAMPKSQTLITPLRGIRLIFESSHPLGPVFGLDTARFRPAAVRVEILVPFQCPQFLQPDPSDRPIKEQSVYRPVMAVDAEAVPSVELNCRRSAHE